MYSSTYRGRFAPSPTGPLHAGSLVAALASWLDARVHGGQWLVRIEDVDTPRTVPGATERILQQLSDCGLVPDAPVVVQSTRSEMYQQALNRLTTQGLAYACTCSRKDIANALQQHGLTRERHGELVYPGTCRPQPAQLPDASRPPGAWAAVCSAQVKEEPAQRAGDTERNTLPPRLLVAVNHATCAWRLRTDGHMRNQPLAPVESACSTIKLVASPVIHWQDRRLGAQAQDVANAVGDFVLKRADGCFTYQLAVVVDDAAQGITHVVRGVDLADNTARQILLQRALGLPTPRYLHTPLVLGANGEKLSKQNGALALETSSPEAALHALRQAVHALGLPPASQNTIHEALATWAAAWQARHGTDQLPD